MFNFKKYVAFSTVMILVISAPLNALWAQCVAAPANMVDWWTADNNTFDIIGRQDGTFVGGAGYGAGKVAQAFNFDGSSGFVQVPNDPSAGFNFNGSFTIDAWVFLNAAPAACGGGFAPIVSKWNDIPFGNNNRSYALTIDSGAIVNGCPAQFRGALRFDVSRDGQFSIPGTHNSIRISNAAVPVNAWTHVAAVFDGSVPNLHVYINGVLADSLAQIAPAVTAPFVNNEPVLIGAGDLGSDSRDFFNGNIDEVELFNRALSASEIHSIYAAGSSGKIIPISIDIKPDGVPNSINLGSKGNVPVAILSSETFDATTVDPATVRFAGAPIITKKNGTLQYSFEDVNGDGLLDLVAHFDTQSLLLDGSSTEATLSGSTFNGRCISGSDSVNIVPHK